MLERTLFNLNKKKAQCTETRRNVYWIIAKLLHGYMNKDIIIKYKHTILQSKYHREIRTGYFTIYPKKYQNIYIEYLLKRQQRYVRKMADSLYVEYMENAYRKYYNQIRFERDSYNSLEKERELFYEYEKTSLTGMSYLFDNKLSHNYLMPKIKDVKRMYKDFKVTMRYYVHMKRLENTFIRSNRYKISNAKIGHIIRKSLIYKMKRPKYGHIVLTRDSMKGPPNLFKESIRMYKIYLYIKDKLNYGFHIKEKSKERITKYMRKFYYDIKWNFIFTNKIFRDIPLLIKKSLRNMYNLEYKINELLLDIQSNKTNTIPVKRELYYRVMTFIIIQEYFNPMPIMERFKHKYNQLKKNTHKVFLIEKLKKIQKELYVRMKLLAIREHIREILRNRIINYYIPYVTIMSKQYVRSGYRAEISDLVQEGTIGVLEAAERYQLGRGVRFLTYAYWWMHRYMIKIAVRKKKVLRLNKKTLAQKKIFIRINELYEDIKKKLDEKYKLRTIQEQKKTSENYNITVKETQLKKKLLHKDFVIYALHTGIAPYRSHTTEQIAGILEIPEYIVQQRLKKLNRITDYM